MLADSIISEMGVALVETIGEAGKSLLPTFFVHFCRNGQRLFHSIERIYCTLHSFEYYILLFNFSKPQSIGRPENC